MEAGFESDFDRILEEAPEASRVILGKSWQRLLARLFGGGVAGDCDVCNRVISRSALEHGRAVILARRHFCPLCVDYVTDQRRRRLRPGAPVIESSTTVHFSG